MTDPVTAALTASFVLTVTLIGLALLASVVLPVLLVFWIVRVVLERVD